MKTGVTWCMMRSTRMTTVQCNLTCTYVTCCLWLHVINANHVYPTSFAYTPVSPTTCCHHHYQHSSHLFLSFCFFYPFFLLCFFLCFSLRELSLDSHPPEFFFLLTRVYGGKKHFYEPSSPFSHLFRGRELFLFLTSPQAMRFPQRRRGRPASYIVTAKFHPTVPMTLLLHHRTHVRAPEKRQKKRTYDDKRTTLWKNKPLTKKKAFAITELCSFINYAIKFAYIYF